MNKYNSINDESVPAGTPGVRPPVDPINKIRQQPPNGSVAKKIQQLTLQDMLRKIKKKQEYSECRVGKQSKKFIGKKGKKLWLTDKK